MGEEPLVWRAREIEWVLDRTLVMGILNVTPDSFSDRGKFLDTNGAVDRAVQIAEEGADILDVGGESTRPGAQPVPADEEWRRIGPLIEAVARKIDLPISVDTYKPDIARKAIRAGAVVVNDVRGLRDPAMAKVVANAGAGAVIMHMKGEPATMQRDPRYEDVLAEVRGFLSDRLQDSLSRGIARESVVLDPGLGFGKTPAHNTAILRSLLRIRELGRPVLVGPSRKSFLEPVPPQGNLTRLESSLAAAALAIANGANIVRVHDVAETVHLVRSPGDPPRPQA